MRMGTAYCCTFFFGVELFFELKYVNQPSAGSAIQQPWPHRKDMLKVPAGVTTIIHHAHWKEKVDCP
jgi:hypothetical protein